MDSKPTIVDLFCGCGGFGLGAELAGFHTVAAVDIDQTLQSAYRMNFPNTDVITADLGKLSSSDWHRLLKGKDVDGVVGGPPCQAFSRLGVGNLEDPRRQLLTDFYRHVDILNPRFFVMENVEGLKDEKNIGQLNSALKRVKKKYTILGPMVVDASEWGAPTKRKRIIVIGFDRTRMAPLDLTDFLPNMKVATVRDAIRDIREPIKQSGDPDDFGWASYRRVKFVSEYAQQMRRLPPSGLGCPLAIEWLRRGRLSGHFDTVHTEKVKARYEGLAQGKTDAVSRAKKLAWGGLCPTLRAGTGTDKGSHQAVRPIHPDKGRVITVREAARLQGFPDWFCFHATKWHSFRMIGNSVSPIVSEAILTVIYRALSESVTDMIA